MTPLKRTAIIAIGLYIALSPALPHLFGTGHSYIRFWSMFTGVGSGLLKGDFTLTQADGTVATYKPIEILGLERYPDTFHYTFDRRVTTISAIRDYVAPFCATVPGDATLDFNGRIGVVRGWASWAGEDLCQMPADPAIDTQEAPNA